MADQLNLLGGAETYGRTAPYGPNVHDLGEDPALTARLTRRQQNRDRIEGKGASRERHVGGALGDARETKAMSAYGIRTLDVETDVMNDRRNRVPYGPHDGEVFRKAGVDREVPLHGPDALNTMQDTVMPERVSELVKDPGMGSDPRFPGQERPLSVQLNIRPEDGGPKRQTDVLWNGNHRVAAAVERGEMFTPVRSITEDRRPDAARAFSRGQQLYGDSRIDRTNIAGARMIKRDATVKEPFTGREWARFESGKDVYD